MHSAQTLIDSNLRAHTVDGPLTAELLRERMSYDPLTGVFTRLKTGNNTFPVGASVGCSEGPRGYLVTKINRRRYYLHRLAWLHTFGDWPTGVIDHINGNKADNRLDNLRDVEVRTNAQNQRKPMPWNSTGLLGVSHHSKGFSARIQAPDGKQVFVGYFKCRDAAHAAYINAKRAVHAGNTL